MSGLLCIACFVKSGYLLLFSVAVVVVVVAVCLPAYCPFYLLLQFFSAIILHSCLGKF